MWKDFFYFSKMEKQGVIVLAILICIVIFTGGLLSLYRRSQEPVYTENPDEEYNQFIATLRGQHALTQNNRPSHTHYPLNRQNAGTTLTYFDPNTADSITFCRIGIAPWLVRNILRYRAKGGIFRQPKDFQKIYGLSEEQYITLLPYIHISSEFQK